LRGSVLREHYPAKWVSFRRASTGSLLHVGGAFPADLRDVVREAITAFEAADYERARPLLIYAAANGSAVAARYLGDLYHRGEGVRSDLAEAARWYLKAANAGDTESQYRIASMLGSGVGVDRNPEEAFSWGKKAADKGHVAAMEFVANAYWWGQGTSVDNSAAVALYLRLAEGDSLIARERLGSAYMYGFGVAVNVSEALRYYLDAASRDHIPAFSALGLLYESHVSGAPDWAAAVRWYKRGADFRDAYACLRLGRMYADGEGVPTDDGVARRYLACAVEGGRDVEAAFWLGLIATRSPAKRPDYEEALRQFRKCADANWASCIGNLGWMHYHGHGVKRDQRRAREYMKSAAELHNTYAAKFLGRMCEQGEGGLQDFQLAAYWYFRAAALGDPLGQRLLSNMYELGRGVEQDLVEAYKWLNIAAATTNDDDEMAKWSEDRDRLADQMAAADVVRAQNLARSWSAASDADVARVAEEAVGISPSGVRRPGNQREANVPQKRTSASSGSGFWISGEGHLLTARHVVEGCSDVRVIDGVGERGGVVVLSSDAKADVAVLKVDARPAHFGALRLTPVRQGEEVTVYGFPLGGALAESGVSTSGTVSALAGLGNDPSALQISAPVQPGNSGGPLVDATGSVIGIVVSKLDALKVASAIGDVPQNVNFAVKVSVAANLMDAAGVAYSWSSSDRKLSGAELTQRVRRITARVECR